MTQQYSYEDSTNVRGVFPVIPLYIKGVGIKYGSSLLNSKHLIFKLEAHKQLIKEIRSLKPNLKGL